MRRIYISGPITGVPDYNRRAFQTAEDLIWEAGYTPVNPHKLPPLADVELPWEDYLKKDLRELLLCDAVVLLEGWSGSRGALLEIQVSRAVGIPVFESITDFTEALYGP